MRARDIMTVTVRTVGPKTPAAEVAKLLVQNRISAVPVVSDAGKLVGIVSEGDLIRRAEIGTEPRRSWWLELLTDPDRLAAEYVKSHGVTAEEIMTRDVVTAKEDTPVSEIAALLDARRIKRVPITRRGKVVGIVSRANLLEALVAHGAPTGGRSAVKDQTLRDQLLGRIKAEPWSGGAIYNAYVTKGVAHLTGIVRSEQERQAMIVAAETLKGIKQVKANLTVGRWSSAV
jgi:CBS domain-containing protein